MARAKPIQVALCGSAIVLGGGCTETPYTFFEDFGSGGICGVDACGARGAASGSGSRGGQNFAGEGGATNSGGAISGGGSASSGVGADHGTAGAVASGGTSAAPQDPCEKAREEGMTLERLQLGGTDLCVAQGIYSPLLGDPAYATALLPCEKSLAQLWKISVMDDGALEFRNQAVDLNLDVRFAASDDGTPTVLFTPHQLYNQRFTVLEGQDGTFKLSPLHAPTKCITRQDDTLLLLPCEGESSDQSFIRKTCL